MFVVCRQRVIYKKRAAKKQNIVFVTNYLHFYGMLQNFSTHIVNQIATKTLNHKIIRAFVI